MKLIRISHFEMYYRSSMLPSTYTRELNLQIIKVLYTSYITILRQRIAFYYFFMFLILSNLYVEMYACHCFFFHVDYTELKKEIYTTSYSVCSPIYACSSSSLRIHVAFPIVPPCKRKNKDMTNYNLTTFSFFQWLQIFYILSFLWETRLLNSI